MTEEPPPETRINGFDQHNTPSTSYNHKDSSQTGSLPPVAMATSAQSLSDSVLPTLAKLDIGSQLPPIATASDPAAPTQNGSDTGTAAAAAAEQPAAASIDRPETSTGSSSHVNSDTIASEASKPASNLASPPATSAKLVPPGSPLSSAAAAVKCKDYASSPPPARPAPTVLGQQVSHALDANGYKGMVSAPAVQTLSSSSTTNFPSPSPSAQAPSASSSGSASPLPRPSASTRQSQGPGVQRRAGTPGSSAGLGVRIPPSLQAKMAAMASRSNNPTSVAIPQNSHLGPNERISTSSLFGNKSPSPGGSNSSTGSSNPMMGGRPQLGPIGGAPGRVSAMGPVVGRVPSGGPVAGAGGLAKRRGPGAGLTLSGITGADSPSRGAGSPAGTPMTNGRQRPNLRLPGAANGSTAPSPGTAGGTPFSNFSKIVDPSGSLNFQNKAVLHAKGVDFSNGSSFKINMDELELQDELGAGNYGTVQKVYHKVTKVTMAMKEIRLELDDSKLKAIITELDILHRATAPEIVDFYGAFFIESCVYYCMEFMDAGSLDKLAGAPVPEPVLKRVTASTVRGLKFLKDELQTMHRDVKPTNVLVNRAGAIKLCDFGVSGQLERSLAKTNIGCQSYMAPERIKGESLNFLGTYTVSSDVWSLGLTIIEFTLGHYPYPPETYSNVFAQLQAIVHGDPPGLPDGYSREADDFVARCLHKDANKRPSYAQLLQHPFLADEPSNDVDMAGWVKGALEWKQAQRQRNSTSSSASSSSASASPLPSA